MTEALLMINLLAARQKADELSGIARRLRTAVNNEINSEANTIASAWQGEAGNKYVRKLRQQSGDLLSIAGQFDAIAATIRSVAQSYYNAELRAIQIAKNSRI